MIGHGNFHISTTICSPHLLFLPLQINNTSTIEAKVNDIICINYATFCTQQCANLFGCCIILAGYSLFFAILLRRKSPRCSMQHPLTTLIVRAS
jgi:hypothetical protein